VNALTTIAASQLVHRIRPPARAAEGPDFFTMIDHQAGMLVNVAKIVSEVLQGRESGHSLRLLDLEQRRAELQRRNGAAVDSLVDLHAGIDEIHWTMQALDRAAAGLFRTARGFHQLHPDRNQAICQMMAVIQKASESLQRGYARLANGSPAAELDADAAIGSRDLLGCYQSLSPRGTLDGAARSCLSASQDRAAVNAETTSCGRAVWLQELYGNLNDIAHDLAGAGAILKRWSRQLSAGRCGRGAAAGMCPSLPWSVAAR
jgi:hypothetical protein